jgi:ribonuclease HI
MHQTIKVSVFSKLRILFEPIAYMAISLSLIFEDTCGMSDITLYTDGSSRGNPGPGGYGIVLLYKQHRKELSKGFRQTTNNRMELLAVIEGLKALTRSDLPVHIYSDSQYVVNAVEKGWLNKWLQTGFKGGKKNADLWRLYHETARPFKLQFHWVRGHAENALNNRCDVLATEAADGADLAVDAGFESGLYNG